MSTDRPLLSIAVPTFNRARFLHELLTELCPQLLNQPEVELLVADNASTDDTHKVIAEFQQIGLIFRYLRNETNIGSDANFLQCFDQSRGKYVWLIGDDDIVLPKAVSTLISLLRESEYSLVYLCPYSFRTDFRAEFKDDKFRRFAQRIPNGVPFIRKVGTSIAFISAMIVNKNAWQSLEHPELSQLIGSNLMHLGWLLPTLGGGGTDLIVWEKMIAARDGNTGAWGICQVFGYSLQKLMNLTLHQRQSIATELSNNTLRVWFPHMISQIRKATAGSLIQEDFRELLEPLHHRNWRYWFYVFPVATLPDLPARAWYFITQTANRAGRFLELTLTYPSWRRNLIRASR